MKRKTAGKREERAKWNVSQHKEGEIDSATKNRKNGKEEGENNV